MRNKAEIYRTILGALLVAVLGFMTVYMVMPKHQFAGYIDWALSPVGMAMSQSYQIKFDNAPTGFQGYIENAQFVNYENWPPLSFKLLGWWYNLLGDSGIYSSRILSALIYGFNAMLFFLLLTRYGISKSVSIIANAIFIFLPFHLGYSYLIYADVWFPTFLLLALLVYGKSSFRQLCYVLVVVVGTCFFWFTAFLLLASLFQRSVWLRKLSLKRKVFVGASLAMIFLIVGLIVVKLFPDSYTIESFRRHSILGYLSSPLYYLGRSFERLGTLIFEALCLIPILYFLAKDRGLKQLMSFRGFEKLSEGLTITLLALGLYILVFPQWFVGHPQGLMMFSVPIGLIAAIGLSKVGKASAVRYAGALSVLICFLLFFIRPELVLGIEEVERQDHEIVEFIQTHRLSEQKVCLYYDMSKEKGEVWNIGKLGIEQYTNAYTFNLELLSKPLNLNRLFPKGLEMLKDLGVDDYNSETVFFITNNQHELKEFKVLDSLNIDKVSVYQIDAINFD